MNKDLVAIFEYMEREKGIKRDVVIGAIEESLVTAAKKGLRAEANVTANIDPKSGEIEVYCEKEIVKKVIEPATQIGIAEAQEIDPDCELGQFIDIEMNPEGLGRIAAQAARQVISQKLRSAERDVIYEEYRHRVGEIVSGSVKRFARGANLVVDLGKVEALMPAREYPKSERYEVGDRVTGLLMAVQDLDNGGAEVILSRNSPEFARQLFHQEVPEVSEGVVLIEKIVRIGGYRTKIAVRTTDMRVDPVGTCVGVRGNRVKAVVRELNNEKVDIIPFTEDPVQLLQNALDPIEIRKIAVNESDQVISIVVDDDNYAAVIGRGGMNARLNGQLIGYQLEVQKLGEYQKLMVVTRLELAESNNPLLDERLAIEGLSSLIIENLIDGGYDTPRKVLQAGPEDLASISGISLEMADRILEEVTSAFSEEAPAEQEATQEEEL